jgi:hypothetical protein
MLIRLGLMGRTIVVAAVALLLGVFVGGIGPRRELSATKKELEAAKVEASGGGSAAALPFALGMGSLMAAQERARTQEPAAPRGPRPVELKTLPPAPNHVSEGSVHIENDEADAAAARSPRLGFGDEQAFAAAKVAGDVRAAQYRAAFFEAANLPPEKRAAFEETVKKMNDELARAADDLAQGLATRTRKMSPREMADVGARVLEIYRGTDDRFKATLDDGARAALEKTDFDILTQVDIGAFRRLGETMQSRGVSEPLGKP